MMNILVSISLLILTLTSSSTSSIGPIPIRGIYLLSRLIALSNKIDSSQRNKAMYIYIYIYIYIYMYQLITS